jgi:hypothetical protein
MTGDPPKAITGDVVAFFLGPALDDTPLATYNMRNFARAGRQERDSCHLKRRKFG